MIRRTERSACGGYSAMRKHRSFSTGLGLRVASHQKAIETRYFFVKDDSGMIKFFKCIKCFRYCKDLLNPVYTEWGALEVCVSVSFLYMPFYSESDFLIVCSVSLEFFFEFLYFHLLNLGSCLLHTRCQSTTIAVLGVSRAMLCRQSCGTYQVGGMQQCRRNTSNVRSTSSL